MKKLKVFLVSVAIILLAGCGGNDRQNAQQEYVAADTLQQKHHEEKGGGKEDMAGTVKLNNGEKWQANIATTDGIDNMMALVKKNLDSKSSDYKALADNLEKEFITILDKCTMTGEAHEQLHNYLLPLKDKIDSLKQNQNAEVLINIQSYLNNYKNYFQ